MPRVTRAVAALSLTLTAILPVTSSHAECTHYGDYVHPLGVFAPGTYTRAMDYQAPYLYVVHSQGTLSILDASDPADLHEVGSLGLPDEARDIDARGSVAYIAFYNTDELQLIDITDPLQPTPLGSTEIPASPRRVAATDSYAYVPAFDYGQGNHGLYVVDVSDPLAPIVVNRVELGSCPSNVVIAEPYAYVLNRLHLCVFDISNGADPIPMGTVAIPGDAVHMAVRDDHVYVVCDAEEFPAPDNGLYMVNVSDPEMPWIEGSLTAEDGPCLGIGLWEHFAIVGTHGSGFTFIDLSDPSHLMASDLIGIQCCPKEYAVDGSVLFALSSTLISYELHTPFTPEPVAIIPETEGSRHLEVQGNFAYTARDYGHDFCIYDMTDPENPVLTGHEPLSFDFGGELAITEGPSRRRYAYIGNSYSQDGLNILDISDPYAPAEVGFLPLERYPSDFEVEGSLLYVIAGYLGLLVYDISDPVAPQYLSNISFGFSVHRVLVAGTTVYIGRRASYDSRLVIVDASDPASLELVSMSSDPEQPSDFALRDDLLYVADGDGSLLIMDVGDPKHPTTVSRLRTARRAMAVALDGDLLYLADQNGHSGVQLIDISDPTNPLPTGYYPATYATDLAIINGHMLVATYHEPLEVAPLECEISSTPHNTRAGGTSPAPRLSFAANPCLETASLRLHLSQADHVVLTVHDAQGRRLEVVHRGLLEAGLHDFRWNGHGRDGHAMPAGVYFVRAATRTTTLSQPMVVMR